ncbi:MAG: hypothetical protein JNM85_06850 [Chthonomonas sp.]|nr:hypothetical protein [Chthonomonas sp.]
MGERDRINEPGETSGFKRLVRRVLMVLLPVAMVPVFLLSLIIHYVVPDSPETRRRVSQLLNVVAVAGFACCIWYWLSVRRGYGVSALLMFFNLQIADAYASLVPKLPAKLGTAILFGVGWAVAITMWMLRYSVETPRNIVAVGLFVAMVAVYLVATIALLIPEHETAKSLAPED